MCIVYKYNCVLNSQTESRDMKGWGGGGEGGVLTTSFVRNSNKKVRKTVFLDFYDNKEYF